MKPIWLVLAIGLLLNPIIGKAQQKPTKMIGERVVFLQNPLIKKYGYQEYSFSKEKTYQGCKYNDLAGKTATVREVEQGSDFGWTITLQLDSTNKTVYSSITGTSGLMNVGFLSELKLARSWIGRIFYNKVNGPKAMGSWHNTVHKWRSLNDLMSGMQLVVDGKKASNDETEKVPLERFQKVELVDVPGWYLDNLVFVFRLADSSRVFWDGRASDINDPGVDEFPYWQLEKSWWTSNPLAGHSDWSEEFMKAIREGSIKIGMTPEMTIISWGEPLKINRTVTAAGTREQWIYGEFKPYVYFEDGKITGWDE